MDDAGTPHATTCHTCSRPLTGPRRGKSAARRSYPCIPPQPTDESTGLTPRLCERCWRRARYNDPTDTYRTQVRAKQQRWYLAQKRTREKGVGRREKGAGRKVATTRQPARPAIVPVTLPRASSTAQRVSSAQRLLAGR